MQRPVGLQPFPPRRRRRQTVAAGHVHADALAALLLDPVVEIDRVGLERGDVRVIVHRMEAGRGVPGRARREFRPLDQQNVRPAPMREVVQHARADDAAADDDDPIMTFRGAHAPGPPCERMVFNSARLMLSTSGRAMMTRITQRSPSARSAAESLRASGPLRVTMASLIAADAACQEWAASYCADPRNRMRSERFCKWRIVLASNALPVASAIARLKSRFASRM